MTVETNANYINELNRAYPRNRDLIKEGDDHIRLIKSTLQNTFPGITGAVDASSAKLNTLNKTFTYEDDLLQINDSFSLKQGRSCNMGGAIIKGVGDPKEKTDAVNLQSMQGNLVWPVGSIFMTVDSRNPRDILGFGNWSKFAAGRVIIGTGSTTDASSNTSSFVNEQKGGDFSVKITTDQLPSHTHSGGELKAKESGTHKHLDGLAMRTDGGQSLEFGGKKVNGKFSFEHHKYNSDYQAYTSSEGNHDHEITGNTGSTGKSLPVNNMQPFIACNIWVRNPDE